MHFLREGQFAVASAFLTEAAPGLAQDLKPVRSADVQGHVENGLGLEPLSSETLRRQFANMYHILEEMRNERNLVPAIQWAKENSANLEVRGSNLEFELERLQFVWLFTGGPSMDLDLFTCQQRALDYARTEFCRFQGRYLREIQRLVGAMAFGTNITASPYRQIFCNQGAWEELAMSFTREFCSLLGLSADSPLYIAATAGAISLPTLQKLKTIQKLRGAGWTSHNELPVSRPFGNSQQSLTLVGGNSTPFILPFSLDIRVSGVERADDGRESTDDDALRSRYCARVVKSTEQGEQIQMPLLSRRISSEGREEGLFVVSALAKSEQ